MASKVLNTARERGAFTLLIHSPTGYDAREFLVSIFQSVCEEVVSTINAKFGEADSLSERGAKEERRLRNILWATMVGITLVMGLSVGFAMQD